VKEVVPDSMAGERLDRSVAMLAGVSRSEAAEIVAAGRVRIGGRPVTTRSHRLAAGDVLEVDAPVRDPSGTGADPSVSLVVVYEDAHVAVVDKPAGLVVHPGAGRTGGTLVNGLLARYPGVAGVGEAARPGIVHRLDKGTSGLLVVALSAEAYGSLVGQLSARSVDRGYTALVYGHFESPRGVVDAPIGRSARDRTRMAVAAGGREARTGYEVLEEFTAPVAATLVRCRLETGRTHQVRVHLAAIGHPVVGDARYGPGRKGIAAPRPLLHAASLAFTHPATGEQLSFESALPPDFSAVLSGLTSADGG
jgi:23S rRNA pseudouridine1911/1915/1917 synthase